VTLSGGQQARVGLARAVYADADVYLFDDVLAAVDAGVGEQIVSQCLVEFLAGRTRILVTHGLQYLSACDSVVVMDGGAVAGVHAGGVGVAASAAPGSVLARMMEEFGRTAVTAVSHSTAGHAPAPPAGGDGVDGDDAVNGGAAAAGNETPMPAPSDGAGGPSAAAAAAGKTVQDEERERGRVRWRVFAAYAGALGGWWVVAGLIVAFAAVQAVTIGSSAYLAWWSAAVNDATPAADNQRYLGVYAGISLGSLVAVVGQGILTARATVRAARVLHDGLLRTMLRVPLSFFDTTPLGRVLNRFGNDVNTVDETLGETLSSLLYCLFSVLGTVVLIAVSTPWFLAAAAPLAVWYIFVQRYYVSTSRELQRLQSISASPIYAHFSETIAGTAVVRAFRRQAAFTDTNARLLDATQCAYFLVSTANRWLAVRLETLGTMMTTGAALFAVVHVATTPSVATSFPSLAGLAISAALSVTQTLNWLVRMTSDTESEIVSVERIAEYTALRTENEEPADGSVIHPPPSWPAAGAIEMRDVKLAYRHGLPWVLHGVTCDIAPGAHVGIVGRTGAGKSSFISALFLTADVQLGTITIDGIPIHRVPLATLRSRLTIIPQTPILFTGTLRSNLDVLGGQYTDAQLWDALDKVGMADTVRALPEGLDTPVTEGGGNFSAGQRQLLTIVRALLRNSRVIVLDEVSASVDVASDAVLQRALRSYFRSATVLTIAHRVHTLADSDRILTLDAGRLVGS